jgi:hypothetical protein
MTNTNDQKAAEAFKRALIRAGLLDNNGTILTLCTGDEDLFFEKWHDMARHFIHKGNRVRVAMRAKRTHDSKTLCWPEVTIRDY